MHSLTKETTKHYQYSIFVFPSRCVWFVVTKRSMKETPPNPQSEETNWQCFKAHWASGKKLETTRPQNINTR